MTNVFIAVLNMGLIASFVALGVILIRITLKKAPMVFSYALWAVGLSGQEIDYILKHERTHIIRRDYLIKPLAFGETGVKARTKNVLNYKKPAVWMSIVAITAVIVAAVLLLPNFVQDPKDISDKQIIEAIKNTDYFCYGEVSGGFSDVSRIPVGNLFNLYASTKEVQDKINALPSPEHYAEIPMTDFKAFVQKSFGNYQFAPEQLEEQLSGRVRFDSTDTKKKTIMLAGINGGVIWPGAMPYDITLESVVKDHGRIMVMATIHAYDNVSIDAYYKVEMQLLETKDGYNYVSYGMAQKNELSNTATENITLEYSDESGVYTENYIKKTTGNLTTLLTEDDKEIISGEDVIPLPYVYAVKTNDKYDLLDKETHAKVSSISYDEIFCEKYPDGRLSTRTMKGRAGKYWGLISADGKTLTNPQNQTFEDIQIATYEEVWPIIPMIEDGKYGAIDYKGKVVIKAEWGYLAMDVYNIPNTVFVFDGNKWGGIKLDKNLLASAVDYSLTPPEWLVENYKQIILAQASANSAQLASMFDFAVKYRLDYIPFFAEGNAPQSSSEYLFYAFAINLDNWGFDKGTMSKSYVENVIRKRFEVTNIVHESLRKGWNFDGEKYTAIPSSIRDKPIYVLTDLKVNTRDGKTVYEAAMNNYNLADGNSASEEDMVKIRAEIISGNYSSLGSLQRETFTYYLNNNGEPVFIEHIMTDRPEMKWYYQMFKDDTAFKVLGSISGDFTDDQMATYAVLKMANYSSQNGNTKEEYNAITQKYLGRDIKNFDNGVTKTIQGTDRIWVNGFSYDNGVYVLARDIRDNGDGSMVGDFYCVNVSDSHWTGKAGEFEEAESALLNGDISSFADCDISIKRVVFEVKTENEKQYFKYRSVKNLEENVRSIVLYSK